MKAELFLICLFEGERREREREGNDTTELSTTHSIGKGHSPPPLPPFPFPLLSLPPVTLSPPLNLSHHPSVPLFPSLSLSLFTPINWTRTTDSSVSSLSILYSIQFNLFPLYPPPPLASLSIYRIHLLISTTRPSFFHVVTLFSPLSLFSPFLFASFPLSSSIPSFCLNHFMFSLLASLPSFSRLSSVLLPKLRKDKLDISEDKRRSVSSGMYFLIIYLQFLAIIRASSTYLKVLPQSHSKFSTGGRQIPLKNFHILRKSEIF